MSSCESVCVGPNSWPSATVEELLKVIITDLKKKKKKKKNYNNKNRQK